MKNIFLKIIALLFSISLLVGFISGRGLATDTYNVYQLTDNEFDDINPQINNRGYILWETLNQVGRESYLYDGSKISKLPFFSRETNLKLNNNNKILYNRPDDLNFGIYLYDITETITTKIADNGLLV